MPAHKINVQLLMASVSTNTSTSTSLILVDHDTMLLQQFHQISIKFFIFQQKCAPAHTALRQSAFLPVTLPDVDRFLKFLQS